METRLLVTTRNVFFSNLNFKIPKSNSVSKRHNELTHEAQPTCCLMLIHFDRSVASIDSPKMKFSRQRIKGREVPASPSAKTPVKIQTKLESPHDDAPRCSLMFFFFPAAYFLLKSNHHGGGPDTTVVTTSTTVSREEGESTIDACSIVATPPKKQKHDDDDCWTEEYNRMCQRRRVQSDKKMYFSETTTYRLRAAPLHSPLLARKLHY